MRQTQRKKGVVLRLSMTGALILSLCALSLNAQEVAVKSNFLHWGILSPNVGIEASVGKRFTLEIPVTFNPWSFSDNKKWKHILVQPEIRWWACEPFSGHFFGAHLHYARFNAGNVNIGNLKFPVGIRAKALNDYRHEGWLNGAGAGYGYQVYISPRINLELAVGAGYAYLNYKKYECVKCGNFIENGERHYFGPTKAAVSLVYIIH